MRRLYAFRARQIRYVITPAAIIASAIIEGCGCVTNEFPMNHTETRTNAHKLYG